MPASREHPLDCGLLSPVSRCRCHVSTPVSAVVKAQPRRPARLFSRAISDAVGLPLASIDDLKGEPGFFLEAAIARQLRELKRPLDARTARALWAFRWDELPPPEQGATNYWRVPFPSLARRLGGSLWANIRRRGGNAWLWGVGIKDEEISPIPAIGGEGTLILVGEISNE